MLANDKTEELVVAVREIGEGNRLTRQERDKLEYLAFTLRQKISRMISLRKVIKEVLS